MKVILDTNFLIYCTKQRIDYKEEMVSLVKGKYDIVTSNQVVDELNELKKKAKKYADRQAAELALKLLKVNKIKTIKTKGKDADEGMIKISKGNFIATTDKELKNKVERSIVIKGRKRLGFG